MKFTEYILKKINMSLSDLEGSDQISINKIAVHLNFTEDEDILPDYKKRLDSLWTSFEISDDLKKAEKYGKILKEFSLEIKEGSNREFKDKKSVVTSLIRLHGYDYDDFIKEGQLNKLKQFYKELNFSIKDITLVELEKLKILEFKFLKSFEEIELNKIIEIGKFLKSLGLTLISEEKVFYNANEIAGLLNNLGYEDEDFTKQDQLEKLELLLKEHEVSDISVLRDGLIKKIIYIFSEFNINFQEISILDLEELIDDLNQLTITSLSSIKSIKAKIYLIKEFKENISNLNSQEITKLAKLIQMFELDDSDINRASAVLEWMKGQGIKCDLKFLTQEELGKIADLKERIAKLTNKEFKNITANDIAAINKIYDSFSDQKIKDIDIEKLENLGKTIASSFAEMVQTEDYSNAMSEVMKVFNIDLFAGSKNQFEELSKLLKESKVNIWQLSESEAIDLKSTLTSFGVQLGKDMLADKDLIEAIKESISSFKYDSLLEVDTEEVEKIISLVQAYGIKELKQIKPDIVKKLSFIIDAFDIRLKNIQKDVIENIVKILKATNIQNAENDQGWVSWAWKGKESAILDKINEIKAKILSLGYKNIILFDEDEYSKAVKILEKLDLSFSGSTVAEIKTVSDNFKYFNYKIEETPLCKLKDVVETLKSFDIDLKKITEHEKTVVDHLNKNLISSLFNMSEDELKSIKASIDKYLGISSKSFLSDFDKLQTNLKSLGFDDIGNIKEESNLCILELESLSKKSSALDRLSGVTDLVSQFIPKLEELELSDCKNLSHYIKVFDYENGSNRAKEFKTAILTKIPENCKISFDEEVKKKTISKIEELIASYNKNEKCQIEPESSDCSGYQVIEFKVDAGVDEICNHYHEDL